MPSQGFQNYRQQQQPPVAPAQVGQSLLGEEPDADDQPMMGGAAMASPSEHSPESTMAAMQHAVGMALARKTGAIPGRNNLSQLRAMGVPESELMIDRLSGLVEGDDQ